MKYHGELHECTIDILRFLELLDALPDVMKEEFGYDYALDRHRETTE